MLNKDKIILCCDRIIAGCLCLLIFCLPFAKAGMETFTWLAIFLWVLKRVLGYRSESLWGMVPNTHLNKALVIFIAANALSTIFTANFGLSLRGFFGKELKFVVIYFMLVETINSRQRLRGILMTIIASAMLMIADAGVQYFRGVDFIRGYAWTHEGIRIRASFISANDFAGWLIVLIPVLLGILTTAKTVGKIWKWLLPILIILLLVCLAMTFSRSGWLGFTTGVCLIMAWYVLKRFRLKTKLLLLSTGIGLLVIFLNLPQSMQIKMQNRIKSIGRISFKKYSQTINSRIKSIPEMKEAAILNRIDLWKESLRIIKDFPLIGSGLNTYSVVARKYKGFDYGGIYPHNSFLQMTAETGLIGLFVFLWVLFRFFQIGMGYLSKKRNPLILGLLAGILSFLVQSFFDTHLYALQMVVLFWFMLGLTTAMIKLN